MTITLVALLHRREGMTPEEFVDYYETTHRLIGERVLGRFASRYVRRYLKPMESEPGADPDTPDVIMEIDFPDQASMDGFFALAGEPETAALIAADEEKIFDRSRIAFFTVEEHSSDI